MTNKKWVYGTRDRKWFLVGEDDRDYQCGIPQERMKKIGRNEARKEYLTACFINTMPRDEQMDVAKTIDFNPAKTIFMKTRDGKHLAPSPYQVIAASKSKPFMTRDFGTDEESALKFREKMLKEGKTALLGSKEVNRKRQFFVEVY